VDIQAIFGLSVLMSFVAFGLVTKLYIWPRLRILERDAALLPLVVPHTFRFIGLSFLVPGVVSPSLPSAFAAPAAYGDLVAAILAVAATIALSRRMSVPCSCACSMCGAGPTSYLRFGKGCSGSD
jgi:hypothetical protein